MPVPCSGWVCEDGAPAPPAARPRRRRLEPVRKVETDSRIRDLRTDRGMSVSIGWPRSMHRYAVPYRCPVIATSSALGARKRDPHPRRRGRQPHVGIIRGTVASEKSGRPRRTLPVWFGHAQRSSTVPFGPRMWATSAGDAARRTSTSAFSAARPLCSASGFGCSMRKFSKTSPVGADWDGCGSLPN